MWNPNWNLHRTDWCLRLDPVSDKPFSEIVLLQFMKHRGLIPSQGDVQLRKQIVGNLELIVKHWILDVGSRNNTKELNAEVVPYGSYALEVYSGTSDIDMLVIAPEVASLKCEFFQHLRKLIEAIPSVYNVRAIERAKVPLLKFTFDGVEVDLACARLKTNFIPRPENLHKENFCIQSAIKDSHSRTTLECVRSNWYVLQAVGANRKLFVDATRLLKCWATCRCIYGNLHCYLGGVHLTVMVAYAIMRYKGVSLAGFIAFFFDMFVNWVWNNPVSLHETTTTTTTALCLRVLKPGTNELCSSNVTNWTLLKIRQELSRGFALTRDLSWKWGLLLEPFRYDVTYQRFIKVRISVLEGELDGWIGFVRSRLAFLIRSLEEDKIIYDPMLTEYVDLQSSKPTGFQAINRVFLWGIVQDTGEKYNLTGAETKWRQNLVINNDGLSGE